MPARHWEIKNMLFFFLLKNHLTKQILSDHTCCVSVIYFICAEMWFSYIALNIFRLWLKHPFISVRNQWDSDICFREKWILPQTQCLHWLSLHWEPGSLAQMNALTWVWCWVSSLESHSTKSVTQPGWNCNFLALPTMPLLPCITALLLTLMQNKFYLCPQIRHQV